MTIAATCFGVITIIRERRSLMMVITCLSYCNFNVNYNAPLKTIPLCINW